MRASRIPEKVKNGDQDIEAGLGPGFEPSGSIEARGSMMNDQKLELIEGSGNVFRDLGEPDAALKQAKAVLAARIIKMLDDSGHTVREAALLSGFAAADFS